MNPRCTVTISWWCGIDPPPESATRAFALSSACSRAFMPASPLRSSPLRSASRLLRLSFPASFPFTAPLFRPLPPLSLSPLLDVSAPLIPPPCFLAIFHPRIPTRPSSLSLRHCICLSPLLPLCSALPRQCVPCSILILAIFDCFSSRDRRVWTR